MTSAARGVVPGSSRVAWVHADAGDGWHLTVRSERLDGRWSTESFTFDELDDLLEFVRDVVRAGL